LTSVREERSWDKALSEDEAEAKERRHQKGEKGGDDVNWADMNLIEPKNKENLGDRFSCYKWMVKI
jgi:hypothetical protein